MTVQVRQKEDGFAVSGELDLASADDLRIFIASMADASHEVVLDIADLAFMDSSGVKAIVRLAETACPHGILLKWPRDNVLRALELMEIERITGIRIERR
jgi:anti-anti-sigma factor